MDFRILGPLEVYDRGEALPLGAGKQRAVLALLLLHANDVVSADRLIDELWGEAPPPTAGKILQNYVSQLRRPLSDGVLLTRGHGYVLRVEPGELDLDRFRRLVDEGRRALAADDPERAADALREALDLWRGQALEDFAYEPFARDEIPRLEELRLTALVERIDADLALGRHELVGELEALIAQHPLQERLRGQLMLALYRSGRQAEALHVYQEARRMLVEELGIEPGQALQQLETAILRQDPSLVPPAPRRKAVLDTVTARPSRLRALIAAAALLAVGAGTAAGILLSRGHAAKTLTAVAPNSVGVIDPKTNKLVGEVAVGNQPSSIATGGESVWVLNGGDQTVTRIDPQALHVLGTIGGPYAYVTAIAFGDREAVGAGAPWIAAGGGTVRSLGLVPSPTIRYESTSLLDVPDLVVESGDVWVASEVTHTVVRIDLTTYRVLARIHVPAAPLSIAAGDGALWFTDVKPSLKAGDVARIDLARNVVAATVSLPAVPTALAVAYGAVWVAVNSENAVWRIDPRTRSVARTIQVGDGPFAVAVGEGAVWVVNAKDATVSRIDPSTNEVVATIRVGGSPRDVAVGRGRVWVAVS